MAWMDRGNPLRDAESSHCQSGTRAFKSDPGLCLCRVYLDGSMPLLGSIDIAKAQSIRQGEIVLGSLTAR